LRWALARLPLREEEKARLAREDYERNAFVPNVERILLAVDDSANGLFALKLAGLLAGSRGMPVTVLNVDPHPDKKSGDPKEADSGGEGLACIVRRAANEASEKENNVDVPKVDVIVRKHGTSAEEAIALEAERGYDLLMLGIEQTVAARGGFHNDLSRLARQFEGSVAVVLACGEHAKDPARSPARMLIPVTGNENSRRGAEVGITIARSARANVVALAVIHQDAKNRGRLLREIKAVSDEIRKIATYLKAKLKFTRRTDADTDAAILQTIERDQHDIVVMGVSRRPGDTLSFGDVADTLLKQAKCSLLFIAPQARGAMKSTPKGGERAPAEGVT
jgi:nucleotide-binding universal stress UspA family protein